MKQYFKYFRIWFILFGICAVVTLVVWIGQMISSNRTVERGNTSAPTERVYDYADVLSDEEEETLRSYINAVESRIHHDVVLVTLNESVLDMYGYENTDYYWDKAITAYADDFYDYKYYGYDEAMGDGVILVDNWYEGEKGTKFS
ncbi:MAG: TPM domain-containing protein, partial [Lachnospiraceae bacterium]|nr:TPM domain-containing protein [Lachnospiraceae bacterium]